MQYQILKFFCDVANPALMAMANILSAFGEEYLMILIIVAIYYIWDKSVGFSVFSSLLGAELVTNGIKAIVRFPRPFTLHPELLADRLETATGYSFPSGHTTGAASLYPAIGRHSGKRWLLVLTIALAILVGLSRNVLRVHWPLDVVVGLMIGLVFALAGTRIFTAVYKDRAKRLVWCKVYMAASGALALIMAICLTFDLCDEVAFSDLMKMMALAAGCHAGCILETLKADFEVVRTKGKAVANVAIVVAGVLLIMLLGSLAPEGLYYPVAFIRYSALGLWATGLWPVLGVRYGLLKASSGN